MTTPDHTPYLREGDLRTPEDVLAWLNEIVREERAERARLAPSSSFGPPVRARDRWAVQSEAVANLARANLARANLRAALRAWEERER